MKFEEALAALREGAKIWHPKFAKDEYLAACWVGFHSTPLEERSLSIVKVKGDRQHDSMAGRLNYVNKIKIQLKQILSEEEYKKYRNIYTDIEISKIFDNDLFLFPQLNLLLVMSEEWKIAGEIK